MHKSDDLMEAISRCQIDTHKGYLYRAVQLQYIKTLTSTVGSLKSDNRYTAKGVSAAMYLAEAPDLAMLESSRQFQRAFGTPMFPAYSILPVEVNLRRVLDVTSNNMANIEILGTSIEELTGDWRASKNAQNKNPLRRVVCHDLGLAAKAFGIQGIKYNSAYDNERWNMVIFTENLDEEKQIVFDIPDEVYEVLNAEGDSATKLSN